jgi:hypothetical protein
MGIRKIHHYRDLVIRIPKMIMENINPPRPVRIPDQKMKTTMIWMMMRMMMTLASLEHWAPDCIVSVGHYAVHAVTAVDAKNFVPAVHVAEVETLPVTSFLE